MTGDEQGQEAAIKENVQQEGLRLAFRQGELVPWKGIMFRVSLVETESLTLIPVRMTASREKELHHARR